MSLRFRGDIWTEIYIWKTRETNTSSTPHPGMSLAELFQGMLWILIPSHHSESKEMGTNTVELSQILSGAFKIHSLNVLKWYTVLSYWINKGTTIHRA